MKVTQTIEDLVKPLTKGNLIAQTEKLVREEGMQYAEAIIHICDKNQIDPEDIAKLISGPLKDKLEVEARRNNILPRSNTFEFA